VGIKKGFTLLLDPLLLSESQGATDSQYG